MRAARILPPHRNVVQRTLREREPEVAGDITRADSSASRVATLAPREANAPLRPASLRPVGNAEATTQASINRAVLKADSDVRPRVESAVPRAESETCPHVPCSGAIDELQVIEQVPPDQVNNDRASSGWGFLDFHERFQVFEQQFGCKFDCDLANSYGAPGSISTPAAGDV